MATKLGFYTLTILNFPTYLRDELKMIALKRKQTYFALIIEVLAKWVQEEREKSETK